MVISERERKRLENITSRINNPGNSLTGKLKKAVYLVPLIWLAGALDGESQEEYLEKAGFRKENAKYLTIANAAIFGLGISVPRYYLGEEVSEGIKHASDFLGMTSETLNEAYFKIDFWQSIGRIIYSSSTGKPIISFSLTGFGGTYIKKGVKYVKNKRKKKPVEG